MGNTELDSMVAEIEEYAAANPTLLQSAGGGAFDALTTMAKALEGALDLLKGSKAPMAAPGDTGDDGDEGEGDAGEGEGEGDAGEGDAGEGGGDDTGDDQDEDGNGGGDGDPELKDMEFAQSGLMDLDQVTHVEVTDWINDIDHKINVIGAHLQREQIAREQDRAMMMEMAKAIQGLGVMDLAKSMDALHTSYLTTQIHQTGTLFELAKGVTTLRNTMAAIPEQSAFLLPERRAGSLPAREGADGGGGRKVLTSDGHATVPYLGGTAKQEQVVLAKGLSRRIITSDEKRLHYHTGRFSTEPQRDAAIRAELLKLTADDA